ncbi:hypothetical protein VaNZ11_014492 [Volvox africanus]|uniref:Serine/threonine-protein kinase n=1 Tax=Volvox africanus TaxID=51714 RepID=A0ABQ5SJX8_9CHLO|nr:hypothetical protein VaNZ11_014492 [Volvox africanus]
MHRRRPVVACPRIIYYTEDREQESFIKHRLLGYGGFAAVYEVERVSDGCRMAAKVLPLSSLADANKLRRVQNEIDINQLLHHPHIVTFLGSFQDEQNVYLLQELCCITLSELLKHVGKMTELQAAHILWQVLSALEHLHGCRVAHRDLKLSNMFLAQDGTVKVGDLGLACHLPTPSCRRRSTCGSLNWMAPEVLRPRSNGYGLEVDIWALGVMLFTLLVGRPPFAAGRDSASAEELLQQTTCGRILQGRYRMPGANEVVLGPEACDLVARLLVVDPAARPSLEQLRSHAFFRLHLGALALTGPLMLRSPWEQQNLSPPERAGSAWEDRLSLAASEDSGLRPSLSIQSQMGSVPPPVDIRLLLCNAGRAALAAHAAGVVGGSAACDSTSGSYMELSQSEQCSVITAISTTTTNATGGRGGGSADPRWQPPDALSSQLTRSHDAARTRSHPQLPPYRMSEQITRPTSGLQFQGGKGKSFARGSVPNSPFVDHSAFIGGIDPGSTQSISSLTHETSGASPPGVLTCGGSTIAGPFPTTGSTPALPAQLLTSSMLSSSPQPSQQYYNSHHCHPFQHSLQQQLPYLPQQQQTQPAFTPGQDTQQLSLAPPQSSTPFLCAPEAPKALPGGGTDQHLPAHGLMVLPHAHPHPRGGEWQELDTGGDGSSYAECLGAPLDRQASWMRSCTGLSRHTSAALSSRSTSQRSSAFIASFVHTALGPQHTHAQPPQLNLHTQVDQQRRHQHDDQRLLRQQRSQSQHQQASMLPGRRRRTVDSTISPVMANFGMTDRAEAADTDAPVCDNLSSGPGGVNGMPPQAISVLRTAFLSQCHHFQHAAAVQARRLQASRSVHARNSMRIAAGLRSVPGGSGLDEEPENDASSDTVRSYADSLEAMLLGRHAGINGTVAAAMLSSPAPVMPSGMARYCHAHNLGQGHHGASHGVNPSPGLQHGRPVPAVPTPSAPIVLRHARSSIGAAPLVRRCAPVYSGDVVHGNGHDNATGAVPLLPSGCRATPLTPWLQADGAGSLHSAPCTAAISSGPASSQIAGSLRPTSGGGEAALTAGYIAIGIPAAKSLPADLEAPRLPMALPPYQGPSYSTPRHSSSAATTPQHSEPLSLAVFAIQQSKGLPNRGLSSTPNGLDGATLDVGLCICSGVDSPHREGSGWSSGQVQLRASGPGPGSGVTPALFTAAAKMDPGARALEAERAVANLEFFTGNSKVATHTDVATLPATSVGTAFADISREEATTRENQKSLSQYSQPQEVMLQQPQQQLLSSELIGRAHGPPMPMSHCYSTCTRTAAGRPMLPPVLAAEGCLTWESRRYYEPGPRQAGSQATATINGRNVGAATVAPQPLPGLGQDIAGVGPGRNVTGVWYTESVSLRTNRDAAVPSFNTLGQHTPQNPSLRMFRTSHLHRPCSPAKDQEQHQGQQQELSQRVHQEQQQRSKSCRELGSGFRSRMYMHPWRAMALTRVRQEAMRLYRIQHEEVSEVEAEGQTQPLEEWGDTSSRSGISAAHLEPRRLQVCGASARLTPFLHNPDAPGHFVSTAAASGAATPSTGIAPASIASSATVVVGHGQIYADSAAVSLGGSGSFGDIAATPRSDSGKQATTAALSSRAAQSPVTGAAKTVTLTRTDELPWTASAPAAVRSHTSPPVTSTSRAVAAWLGAASPAATAPPVAARCAAVATASCSHPRKHAPSAFDRLGLCCRILPTGCTCGGGPVSPIGSDTSPYRHGDCKVGPTSPGPKRRVASLDVERVLRHLESSDPDDLAMATVLPSDNIAMLQGTTTMRSPLAADSYGKPTGACTSASQLDSERLRHAEPAEEVDRCRSHAGASPNVVPSQLRPASLGSSQPHGSKGGAVEAETVLKPCRNPAPSVMISLSPPHNDEGGPVSGLGATAISAVHFTSAGDHGRSITAETGRDMQEFRLNTPLDSNRVSMDVLPKVLGCPEVDDATAAPAAPAKLSVSCGPVPAHNAMAGIASRFVDEAARMPPPVPHSVMSIPRLHECTQEGQPAPLRSSCPDRLVATGDCTSEERGPLLQPPPAGVTVLPRSLPGPAVSPSYRLSTSATGMCSVSNGGMATDAVPEMDPDALAELASRLRFKSFKDAMGSRTGSFTYRPSRMMPAGQCSPSRRTLCSTVGQPGVSGFLADEVSVRDGGGGAADTAPSEPAPGRPRSQVYPRDVLMVKWIDYSSKYGLSYVLSNGAVGVLFRDGTQLLRNRGDAYAWLLGGPADTTAAGSKRGAQAMQLQGLVPQAQPLLLQEGQQASGHGDRHHHDVSKKLRLLSTFEGMLLGSAVGNGIGAAAPSEDAANLEPHVHFTCRQAGQQECAQDMPTHETGPTATASLPPPQPPPIFVTWWTRTKKALVLYLSSGTLQALFCDGSELVVREEEDEVEYLARDGLRTSCSLSSVRLTGPKTSVSKRIEYATMLVKSRAGKHSYRS